MKCLVYSNLEFNQLMKANGWDIPPTDCAFISICDPGYEDRKFGLYHYFKDSDNVINLDFHDIEDYSLPGDGRVKGLSDEQAKKLYEFIKKNLGKDFYIHCAAGVSRSQGVAKFITDIYFDLYPKESMRKENPCDFPNLHVVSLLKHIYYNEIADNPGCSRP